MQNLQLKILETILHSFAYYRVEAVHSHLHLVQVSLGLEYDVFVKSAQYWHESLRSITIDKHAVTTHLDV